MAAKKKNRNKIIVPCDRCNIPVTRVLTPRQVFDAEVNTIDKVPITCIACRQKIAREQKISAGTWRQTKKLGRMSADSDKIHRENMMKVSPCRHLSLKEIKELEGQYTPPVKEKKIAFVI